MYIKRINKDHKYYYVLVVIDDKKNVKVEKFINNKIYDSLKDVLKVFDV